MPAITGYHTYMPMRRLKQEDPEEMSHMTGRED